jgi:hypothetical protein
MAKSRKVGIGRHETPAGPVLVTVYEWTETAPARCARCGSRMDRGERLVRARVNGRQQQPICVARCFPVEDVREDP